MSTSLYPMDLIDGGWKVVRGCASESLMQHDVGQWKSYAQDLNTTEKQFIKEAADHLRDVWGATDAEARQCGLDLGDSQWYSEFCFVIQGHNTRGFIAHNPTGSIEIYLDRQHVSTKHTTPGLALILYTQWSHMQYGPSEKPVQTRLNQFRQRHAAQHIVPQMKHGGTDFRDAAVSVD